MSSIEHYENFPVASWLCPAHIRPAVMALYHFARTADDLADEGYEPAHHRLDQLGEYRADLHRAIKPDQLTDAPSANWPHIFGPLRQAVTQHQLPPQPLFDLLDAFEQDVVYTSVGQRYKNRAELMHYCHRSANPVGRLMLHLYGVNDAVSCAQSDAICTALQLINFWQDRAQDLQRGRDYLPMDHNLADELRFARQLMLQGSPLVHRIQGRAGWELRCVVQGGLRVLDKLEARGECEDHTQLARPKLTRSDALRLLWRCIRM
jgi:squalene synthase HpnC